MVLATFDGKKVIIEAISFSAEKVRVYNFEVEGNHNYYVSENTILVHNNCDFPMKPSRFGDRLDVAYFNEAKIRKMSHKDLQDVISKFETSIKSRSDEAANYLINGRGTPQGTRGHNLIIQMEKEYLQKLNTESLRRNNLKN